MFAYNALLDLHDTPVVRCNRAVALAMNGELEHAEAAIAALSSEPSMTNNRFYHVARAEVFERSGHVGRAREAYERALQFAEDRDRKIIEHRLKNLPTGS